MLQISVRFDIKNLNYYRIKNISNQEFRFVFSDPKNVKVPYFVF